jgi:hypothetical protein
MMQEALRITLQVIQVLKDLGVAYHLGGSFASSVHGVPRLTRDADLVADLSLQQVHPLAAALADDFYADEEAMREAVRKRGSFNLIHLESGFKVDIFMPGNHAFDAAELARSRVIRLVHDPPHDVMVKSPEDTVLRKLRWYRDGGEVSQREWTDALGVLKAQGDAMDLEYLTRWAEELNVSDLIQRALGER